MSEKMEVELKEEDRKLLKSAIEAAKTIKSVISNQSEQPPRAKGEQASKPESGHEQGHDSIEDLLACPNCYPTVKTAVFKKEAPNLKAAEIICEDCGLPVKIEDEICPWCGGKDARKRES